MILVLDQIFVHTEYGTYMNGTPLSRGSPGIHPKSLPECGPSSPWNTWKIKKEWGIWEIFDVQTDIKKKRLGECCPVHPGSIQVWVPYKLALKEKMAEVQLVSLIDWALALCLNWSWEGRKLIIDNQWGIETERRLDYYTLPYDGWPGTIWRLLSRRSQGVSESCWIPIPNRRGIS